jgi:hypothetical protein
MLQYKSKTKSCGKKVVLNSYILAQFYCFFLKYLEFCVKLWFKLRLLNLKNYARKDSNFQPSYP